MRHSKAIERILKKTYTKNEVSGCCQTPDGVLLLEISFCSFKKLQKSHFEMTVPERASESNKDVTRTAIFPQEEMCNGCCEPLKP